MVMAAGLLVVSGPAHAQFSSGFKFLEAVKKRDGAAVESMLSLPGSTIVNTRDVTSGETGLHLVTARRDLTWMTFLLSKGANVNARDSRGRTPLVVASNLGFDEGVELLVSKGARVDEANDAGETPLIAAVHNQNFNMIRILLKAGGNPDRADNSGRSARDYAKITGNNRLLSEIEANTKPRTAQPASGPAYGPSL
jgi:ankyrin repeat protein